MSKVLLFIFCFFYLFGLGQIKKNIELLDKWKCDTIITNSSSVRYSGCYGFTKENQEYGVIGTTEGAYFFQVTDNDSLKYIDFVQGAFVSSQCYTREYRAFGNYIYAIGDEGQSSLQIIDISYLPDSVMLAASLQGPNFGRIHNIFIDSTQQLLYACMVTPIENGVDFPMVPLRVFSLIDPLNPTLLYSGMDQVYEVHDLYVRNNIAILNCGYEGIQIYDFSNPSQPSFVNNLSIYNYQGYNHQGWLTPNGKTYVFADETPGLPIKKCEVLDDFTMIPRYFFGTENVPLDKTPHNIQCTDSFAFVAYYLDGLRIYNIESGKPFEVAYYDTYEEPSNEYFSMWGAWGIHLLSNSKRILVSDRKNGFFLLKFDQTLFPLIESDVAFQLYPNPSSASNPACLRSQKDEISEFNVSVFDCQGRACYTKGVFNESIMWLPNHLTKGHYYVVIDFINYLGEASTLTLPWVIS